MERLKKLKSHAGFQRYAKNTAWMAGEKVLRMFVGLLVGVWVARYLGPQQFGLLSYAQSLVFLFTSIATLGLDAIVVRELVKAPERKDELLGTALGLKAVGTLSIFPILGGALYVLDGDSLVKTLVFIIAFSTVFQTLNVIDFYFQAEVKLRLVALANTISLGIGSIVKIGLVLTEAPLYAFAVAVAVDSLILALGLFYFYQYNIKHSIKKWSFKFRTAQGLLKDSWPLILSATAISIYMKVDQLMIKEMINSEAVGYYAAASRLSEAWYFIPMVVASSLFPAIVRGREQSKSLYFLRLRRLYSFMIGLGILIALPVTILAPYLINILYGSEFSSAVDPLKIHIWASIFVFLAVASGKFLIAENMIMKTFYRNILGASVNILLNLLLIPMYGISGAAIATAVAWFFSGYFYDFFDKDVRDMFYVKSRAFLFLDLVYSRDEK